MTPETYTKLVAKRPELAVPWLEWILDGWTLYGVLTPKTTAHALILAHWLEKLPNGTSLARCVDTGLWFVVRTSNKSRGYFDKPLAALAAFWEAMP